MIGKTEVWMSTQELDQVNELKSEHAGLEGEIQRELARPLPNQETLAHLKRMKLRIKDELQRLEAH